MTIEQYKKATDLLEKIHSVKGYISQFESTIEGFPKDFQFESKEDELEYEANKRVLETSISNLKVDLLHLEEEFSNL